MISPDFSAGKPALYKPVGLFVCELVNNLSVCYEIFTIPLTEKAGHRKYF